MESDHVVEEERVKEKLLVNVFVKLRINDEENEQVRVGVHEFDRENVNERAVVKEILTLCEDVNDFVLVLVSETETDFDALNDEEMGTVTEWERE
jgi:hypothetical protein